MLDALCLLDGLEHGCAAVVVKGQHDVLEDAVRAADAPPKHAEREIPPRRPPGVDARLHEQNLPVYEDMLSFARHMGRHVLGALGLPDL